MNTQLEQVCQDLLGLIGLLKGALIHLSDKYDLTIMQVHALYAISQGDNTMGRVADTLHCDASNVTGIVDRLAAGTYITRQESERDRRIKTLRLTDKGQSAVDDIYRKLPIQLGCAQLTADERTVLHEIIVKLITSSHELIN
jgi:DNA-binding MarR family transcriptional regulator